MRSVKTATFDRGIRSSYYVNIINTRRASWQKVSKRKTKKQRNPKRNRHLLSDSLLHWTEYDKRDFAHSFVVLSGHADFLYKTTDYYAPEFERSLVWNDPKIAIAWPFAMQPIVSAKDAQGMRLADAEVFA